MREFHIRRTARERHAIDDALLSARGDLVVADLAAIRHLASRMNSVRPAGAPSVGAGEIVALGLLHEIAHLLTARFETLSAGSMAGALRDVRRRLGDADADLVLDRFASAFPGVGPEPEPAVDRLEELLLHPRRQREPGPRTAARAGGRPDPPRRDALRRPGRRPGGLVRRGRRVWSSGTGRGRRWSSCCGRRPGACPPRSPASCATSGSTGPRSSARISTRSSAGWTSRSASLPRRSAACTCASVAAAGARTCRRTCRRSLRPSSPMRRRPSPAIWTGCRAWCSWPRARTSGSTSCLVATGATCARSTRSRTRSSTPWRAGE